MSESLLVTAKCLLPTRSSATKAITAITTTNGIGGIFHNLVFKLSSNTMSSKADPATACSNYGKKHRVTTHSWQLLQMPHLMIPVVAPHSAN
jgi:hypothetical protein